MSFIIAHPKKICFDVLPMPRMCTTHSCLSLQHIHVRAVTSIRMGAPFNPLRWISPRTKTSYCQCQYHQGFATKMFGKTFFSLLLIVAICCHQSVFSFSREDYKNECNTNADCPQYHYCSVSAWTGA